MKILEARIPHPVGMDILNSLSVLPISDEKKKGILQSVLTVAILKGLNLDIQIPALNVSRLLSSTPAGKSMGDRLPKFIIDLVTEIEQHTIKYLKDIGTNEFLVHVKDLGDVINYEVIHKGKNQ